MQNRVTHAEPGDQPTAPVAAWLELGFRFGQIAEICRIGDEVMAAVRYEQLLRVRDRFEVSLIASGVGSSKYGSPILSMWRNLTDALEHFDELVELRGTEGVFATCLQWLEPLRGTVDRSATQIQTMALNCGVMLATCRWRVAESADLGDGSAGAQSTSNRPADVRDALMTRYQAVDDAGSLRNNLSEVAPELGGLIDALTLPPVSFSKAWNDRPDKAGYPFPWQGWARIEKAFVQMPAETARNRPAEILNPGEPGFLGLRFGVNHLQRITRDGVDGEGITLKRREFRLLQLYASNGDKPTPKRFIVENWDRIGETTARDRANCCDSANSQLRDDLKNLYLTLETDRVNGEVAWRLAAMNQESDGTAGTAGQASR